MAVNINHKRKHKNWKKKDGKQFKCPRIFIHLKIDLLKSLQKEFRNLFAIIINSLALHF